MGPKPTRPPSRPAGGSRPAILGRYAYEKHRDDDDDFLQARALYRDVMRPGDRDHLAENIVAHASDGVPPELQKRVVTYWTNVAPSLGAKVAAGLRGSDAAAGARAA